MKYIKLYEDINQFYYEISREEFTSGLFVDKEKNDEIRFTDNEVKILSKFSDIDLSTYYKVTGPIYLVINNWVYDIYKNPEEWYYVYISKRTTGKLRNRLEKYYKCDQIDGVVKLLEG